MTLAVAERPIPEDQYRDWAIDAEVAHAAALATLATMMDVVRHSNGNPDLPYIQALAREGSGERGVISGIGAAHCFVSQGKDVVFMGGTSPNVPATQKDRIEFYADELGRDQHPYATYSDEPPEPKHILDLVDSERPWSTLLFVPTTRGSRLAPVKPVIVLGANRENLFVTTSMRSDYGRTSYQVLSMRSALGLQAPREVRQRVSMLALSHRLPIEPKEDESKLKVSGR